MLPWSAFAPALSDPDAEVRELAMKALVFRLMPGEDPGDEATARVVAGLADEDLGVRIRAAGCLDSVSWSEPAVTDAILAALRDPELAVRRTAAYSLENGVACGQQALPAAVRTELGNLAGAGDGQVRDAARRLLGLGGSE